MCGLHHGSGTGTMPAWTMTCQPGGFRHRSRKKYTRLKLDGVPERLLARFRHRFGARARAELFQHGFDVELHGMGRDRQPARDHLVGEAVADSRQDFHLARREEHPRAGFGHRCEAFRLELVRQYGVGTRRRIHRQMSGVDDELAQSLAARRIARPDQNPQGDGERHLGDRAHAAGRASISASSESTVPPRITRSAALRPMRSGPSCPAIRRNPDAAASLTLSTMSPATTPAFAAGPPSTSAITITPLG